MMKRVGSPGRSAGSGDDSRLSSGIVQSRSVSDDDDDDDVLDFDDDFDDSLQERVSTISGRGALIRGLNISSSSSSSEGSSNKNNAASSEKKSDGNEDVESALNPPDSDYAPYIPPSLFPSMSTSSTRKKKRSGKGSKRSSVFEGPVGSRRARSPSNWSGSSTSWDEKFKRPTLWYGLACISVLMIGAVIALSVVLTSQKNRDPMTERQKALSNVISSVTSNDAFLDASSPQAKAHNWMVFNDSVALDETNAISRERILQRYYLAIFYYATSGPSSWGENDWLQGDECHTSGNWTNLSCDENGHVKAFVFENFGLSGTIPDEVGHLSHVTNFVVKRENRLTGTIPRTFGKMNLLRQLSLPSNNLVGTIPRELYLATSLSYVNLEENGLSGTLSTDISNLRDLKTLVLSNNNMEGTVPFDNLADTRIEYLGLSSNKFKGAIHDSIRDCRLLKYLYLDRNEMGGVLPLALGEVGSLRSLNLDLNSFAGRIPAILGRLRKLEFLSMQANNFIGSLPGELNLLSSLRTLNFVANSLTGSLPNLSALTDLTNLLLVGNRLQGTIPDSFRSLSSLEILFLSSNQFSGPIPRVGTTSLRGWYVSENQFTGNLPDELCQQTHLESFFADENQLNGTIPSCVGDLPSLKQLYLFKNQLTGTVPRELSRLRHLTGLGLEHNDLEGAVHDSVCPPGDFWSDCGGANPDVTCPCCTVCCPSEECV